MTLTQADKERDIQMYLAYRRGDDEAQQADTECYTEAQRRRKGRRG